MCASFTAKLPVGHDGTCFSCQNPWILAKVTFFPRGLHIMAPTTSVIFLTVVHPHRHSHPQERFWRVIHAGKSYIELRDLA